jgi:hypothetical protein
MGNYRSLIKFKKSSCLESNQGYGNILGSPDGKSESRVITATLQKLGQKMLPPINSLIKYLQFPLFALTHAFLENVVLAPVPPLVAAAHGGLASINVCLTSLRTETFDHDDAFQRV